MATYEKRWWGVIAKLDHGEACALTNTRVVGFATRIANFVGTYFGPLGAVIVAAISLTLRLQAAYIRALNQNSGGKGVKLNFSWLGILYSIQRRGSSSDWGPSPC